MMIWQSGMIIEGSMDRMISTGTNWNKGSDLVNRFVLDQRLVDQVLQKSGVAQTPDEILAINQRQLGDVLLHHWLSASAASRSMVVNPSLPLCFEMIVRPWRTSEQSKHRLLVPLFPSFRQESRPDSTQQSRIPTSIQDQSRLGSSESITQGFSDFLEVKASGRWFRRRFDPWAD